MGEEGYIFINYLAQGYNFHDQAKDQIPGIPLYSLSSFPQVRRDHYGIYMGVTTVETALTYNRNLNNKNYVDKLMYTITISKSILSCPLSVHIFILFCFSVNRKGQIYNINLEADRFVTLCTKYP